MIKLSGATPLIIEVLKCVDVWIGHMMSDVSTSQGVPGIILSLLKEISVLPVFKNTDFRVKVDGCYRKGEKNLSEWGGVAFVAIKRQALPILINEALVRVFYFIRHLIFEVKKHKELKSIDWESVIPFNNRIIVRMMTIATGTFAAVDMADAAIRGVAESGGNPALLAKNFILRVNFVGVGRFAIAVGADVGMGVKKRELEKQRITYYNDTIALAYGCPLRFKAETKWITLDGTEITYGQALAQADKNLRFYTVSANAAISTAAEDLSGFAAAYCTISKDTEEKIAQLRALREKYENS